MRQILLGCVLSLLAFPWHGMGEEMRQDIRMAESLKLEKPDEIARSLKVAKEYQRRTSSLDGWVITTIALAQRPSGLVHQIDLIETPGASGGRRLLMGSFDVREGNIVRQVERVQSDIAPVRIPGVSPAPVPAIDIEDALKATVKAMESTPGLERYSIESIAFIGGYHQKFRASLNEPGRIPDPEQYVVMDLQPGSDGKLQAVIQWPQAAKR